MNVSWSSPMPIRTGRLGLKRLEVDPDEPVSKCARLSESPGDPGLLGSSPGSPVSPVPVTGPGSATHHQGPSRIGQFLLLPLADREGMHSALNIDSGEELVCKVFDMNIYQEKVRAYSVLPAHKNIASIRDIVLGERQAYVFLEKDYGDMHTLVKSCRRLDEDRASQLFHQVASAVAHCHQAGVVLGDLKLRKFVFSDEARTQVKLEGLEDCRVLERPGSDLMSDTHGCPAYVSPEILAGSAPYSGRAADAWSLGVMLYTMLVGRYPFHDPEPAVLFSKIRRGQCCLPEGLSPRARCLLRGLLRKDPWERLSAADVLAHPWFRGPASSWRDAAPAEQEVSAAEQTVPSSRADEADDLFS